MTNKKFKKINVDERTFQRLKYFAMVQNKTVVASMREFSDYLIKLIFQFKKANISYEMSDDGDSLIIEASGLLYGTGTQHDVFSSDTSNETIDNFMREKTEEILKQAETENKESEVDKKIRECFGDVEK